MIDINSIDFVSSYKNEDATVGIIGQGFVGGAMREYFTRKVRTLTFDKFKPELCSKQSCSTGDALAHVVAEAEVIFVCVPTPMRRDGQCYTGIVTSVLNDIFETADRIGRPASTFVVCIKSTVYPGFTEEMRIQFPNLRITFSPEFLTEKNSVRDMLQCDRVVVGGDMDDARVVLRYFLGVDQERVDEGRCVLVQCHSTVAEMVKLYTNGMLFTKVLFSNEVHQMCGALGIPYDEVRIISCLDRRIGPSHTLVPGPDGHLGAGGHCFPKDMANLVYEADRLGVPQRLFTAVLHRNAEVRQDKDWEQMSDRAVTDK